MKRKKSPLRKAKESCWKTFSMFIRIRDAIRTTGTTERCVCCTCGRIYPVKKGIQAGHFLDGRNNAILFVETGVHGQCLGCNCNWGKKGNKVEYFIFMENKYGRKEIDRLRALKQTIRKFTVKELMDMRAEWKKETEYMLKHKELPTRLL